MIERGSLGTRATIGDRRVGDGEPCFIIAEAGVNHNGDIRLARDLTDAAARAGADAIKFQAFHAGEIAIPSAGKAEYQEACSGGGSQADMLSRLELTGDNLRDLSRYALSRGLVFLSSPFDRQSVDLLEGLGVPAYKVASGELTNTPLLRYIAGKGRPVLLSTGMATLEEIGEAVRELREAGAPEIVLLHCVTRYPAPLDALNLRVITTLRAAFGLPVGFSDHSPGWAAPVAAVALGACILEKHLTLDRELPGPDHAASLEPGEFGEMVRLVREVEAGLGTGVKEISGEEAGIREVARRSLVSTVDIPRGAVISEGMVAPKRPGTGIPPREMDGIMGRRTRVAIPRDTLLTWDMFA